VRVPATIALERDGLALEWLDLHALDARAGAALGAALAGLHRAPAGERFGWHVDNYIGATPQPNAWCASWPEFFRERRLRPQLELAAEQGYGGALQREGERLLARVESLLDGHAPAPSLLHGDLWGGNAAALADGTPVIFDPAVYVGDREADLAMTELFGGFPASFHAAYREAWPLADGHALRRELYNLYHLLNHLNLFGTGYLHRCERVLAGLLRSA
jgi:fructosamine-3-kinase